MTKKIKILTSMLLTALCVVTPIGSLNAFAADNNENIATQKAEIVGAENTKKLVEEIDPNIKIVVTEITDENQEPIIRRSLRRTDTYFKFTGGMQGQVRYYQGNHFSVDLTTSSSVSGNFTMSLIRTDGLFDKKVGSVELPRNGSFHVEFLNINKPGHYRFDFNQTGWKSSYQEGTMTIWDWD